MEYDDAGKIILSDKEIDAVYERLVDKVEDKLHELIGTVRTMQMPKNTVNALVHATAIEIVELKEESEYGNNE